MTAPGADRWCVRIVELAARLLPADQRQRYAREFIAELYGMPRARQIRHSMQVLTHAWALRTVLTATSAQTTQEGVMPPKTRRPLVCVLRVHRWDERQNSETKELYEICLLCDAYRERPRAAPGAGAAGVTSSGGY